VQSLVGVARRGRAVAGAVGLPFPSGALASAPAVVYGLVGAGTGTVGGERPPRAAVGGAPPVVATGDSSNAVLGAARAAALAGGGHHHVVGGAGHKLLLAADGAADLAIMHFGTSLWDSCAPSAIVGACGGKARAPAPARTARPRTARPHTAECIQPIVPVTRMRQPRRLRLPAPAAGALSRRR
jgi:fructose-1,6-bisphosphatase/inositol monophosphatase family enzyme